MGLFDKIKSGAVISRKLVENQISSNYKQRQMQRRLRTAEKVAYESSYRRNLPRARIKRAAKLGRQHAMAKADLRNPYISLFGIGGHAPRKKGKRG